MLFSAPVVHAASWSVNDIRDIGDVNHGDGKCLDSRDKCTLRAAIDESNGKPDWATIDLVNQTYGISQGLNVTS